LSQQTASRWRRVLDAYREPRMLAVLFMGFSSGLPLPLTFSTLSIWLAQAGVSRKDIGLFTLVGISYNFKFVWSPLIDRLPLPILTNWLGRRRSWAIFLQVLLAAAIFGLSLTDPAVAPGTTAVLAVVVAFLSASQDIVIDAYRIELLTDEQQGAGVAATQWGYRFGMIAASAGALYAVAYGGWHLAYGLMALLMGVGIVTVLLTPEPDAAPIAMAKSGSALERTGEWLRTAVVAPFADFMKRRSWLAILVFIMLYKLGDALAGSMAGTLYVSLGFKVQEIAAISKVFGVMATLVGVAIGGAAVTRWGAFPSLLVCGIVQNVSTLMYAVLAHAGHNNFMLALSILLENITGGMGAAAATAYMSQLCNIRFTATQFALLTSVAMLGRTVLSSPGGWLSERLGWEPFFVVASFAGLPSLILLLWLMRREQTTALVQRARKS